MSLILDYHIETIKYYDKHAQEWEKTRNILSFWLPEIEYFCTLLKQGKILEIGSGIGKEAAMLVRHGFSYVGIDPSHELLKIAQAACPQGAFLNQDVRNLDFPQTSFDGFWAAASLLHIPKQELLIALQKIKAVMKLGGIGFISLKSGDQDTFDKPKGRWFAHYTQEEFVQVLRAAEFTILKQDVRIETESSVRYSPRSINTWLLFFVRA